MAAGRSPRMPGTAHLRQPERCSPAHRNQAPRCADGDTPCRLATCQHWAGSACLGQYFEPGPQRPGVKRGRSRTRLVGFPVSGEQCRVGSRDRRTPTVPLTLRDQAFDPAKRAVPPICAAVPVHWVTVVAAPNWHFWAAIRSRRRSAISDVCSRPRLGSGSRRSGSSIRTTCESACARPRGVNSPTVSAAPSTAGSMAGLRRLRTSPVARRPASAIAALPGSS